VPSAPKGSAALQSAAEKAVGLAIKAGAQQADALVESGNEFRVDVLQGNVENLKQAHTRGLGLRVFVDHRVALVYTSDLREKSLKDLASRAVGLAKKSTKDEFTGLPDTPPKPLGDVSELHLFDREVADMPTEKKIAMAKELEAAALGYDKRIKRTDGCTMRSNVGETFLASSLGPPLGYRGTAIGMFVNPLADDGDKQQSGNYGEFKRAYHALGTPSAIGREAGKRAVDKVGARSVPTQKVPVILHPDIAADWLGNMFSAFSGEQAFKKVSYLTEKLGQPIASNLITVVDDGLLAGGVSTSPFDGEGVPTRRNVLVDQGVMKMFVYNTYWGRKAKAASTGNAARGYQGSPGIGNRNLHILNGTSTPDDIFKSVDRGFYMVDQGAFGYNQTTGAYSYQAAGFWIEKGAKAFPVQEITVAGNTLDMLKNVTMVGNDLVFNGSTNSPTLKIAEMTISGRQSAG
jgi:PmbA protein